jgi:hypothetical protein
LPKYLNYDYIEELGYDIDKNLKWGDKYELYPPFQ